MTASLLRHETRQPPTTNSGYSHSPFHPRTSLNAISSIPAPPRILTQPHVKAHEFWAKPTSFEQSATSFEQSPRVLSKVPRVLSKAHEF